MHDIQIDFLGDGTNEARGLVSGHCELEREGKMMVGGLRYQDVYRNTADGWRFAERLIGFLYYAPVADYPGILLRPDRNLAYAEPLPADFPEALPGWQRSGGLLRHGLD